MHLLLTPPYLFLLLPSSSWARWATATGGAWGDAAGRSVGQPMILPLPTRNLAGGPPGGSSGNRSSPAQIRLANIFPSPPRGQIRWRRPRIGRRRCRCGSCGADMCCARDGDAARQVRRDGQLLHLKIVFLAARSRDGCGTRPYKYNFTRPRNYLCSSEFGPKKKHRVIIRPNP